MRCVGVVPPYVNKISPLEPFSLHCLKQLFPHCTRLTTYVDTGTCTVVSRKHTFTLLTRLSCSWDEATERWLHRSQTKTATHGSQVHMWAWHCCCAERTTCRILPISAFHFNFQFPPFPLALLECISMKSAWNCFEMCLNTLNDSTSWRFQGKMGIFHETHKNTMISLKPHETFQTLDNKKKRSSVIKLCVN